MEYEFDMPETEERLTPAELPFDLSPELGNILNATLRSPGVYYLSVEKEDDFREVYVVTPEAPAISQQARDYGETLPDHPELRIYDLDTPGSGRHIIDFEVCRYQIKCHLPLRKMDGSLYTCALYGAEENPAYFGQYPVPLYTPRGRTVRHKVIINGVYWLETERCEELLAVCYPIWSADLPTPEHALGEQLEYDRMRGIDSTEGYLFFPKRASCIPLYALRYFHPEIEQCGVVDLPALRNAICEFFPEYTAAHNAREARLRNGDIIPGAGTDYIRF